MNRIWKEIGIAFLMGMVLPGLLLHLAVALKNDAEESIPVTEPSVQTEEMLTVPVLMDDGRVREMELDKYITGVVLAEMPASFETEAMKAQSVVARTYALRAHGGKSKHEGASVCTDSACCQGYRELDDYRSGGGMEENIRKVQNAVMGTSGYVLTYEGELIEATYFSCSGGYTEDAVAVWGTDVPYLKAVSSPGEENAAHYTDETRFTRRELEERLEVQLLSDGGDWFSDMTYTAGGGIEQMRIGGKLFKGTELRKLLGLRSTAFAVTVENDHIIFKTRGFGHRVGMSQYGADAMAVEGHTYREILMHYYPGTILEYRTD